MTDSSASIESEDWVLVQRARTGDRPSFERLYRRHAGRVNAMCRRLSGRADEAEELTQEVFVRAWQNRHKFRQPGHFPAWLNRVAVNLVMNARRTAARRGASRTLDDEPGKRLLRSVPPPSGLRTDLEEAISALPERARTVLVLHDIHGFRHQEIASMTGTAVGTSKAQLHRARKRLRERLES